MTEYDKIVILDLALVPRRGIDELFVLVLKLQPHRSKAIRVPTPQHANAKYSDTVIHMYILTIYPYCIACLLPRLQLHPGAEPHEVEVGAGIEKPP